MLENEKLFPTFERAKPLERGMALLLEGILSCTGMRLEGQVEDNPVT